MKLLIFKHLHTVSFCCTACMIEYIVFEVQKLHYADIDDTFVLSICLFIQIFSILF